MTEIADIPKKIAEIRDLLAKINDGQVGAELQHERISNQIAVTNLDLEISHIRATENLSQTISESFVVFAAIAEVQKAHAIGLVQWTRIMAFAIIVQSIALAIDIVLKVSHLVHSN